MKKYAKNLRKRIIVGLLVLVTSLSTLNVTWASQTSEDPLDGRADGYIDSGFYDDGTVTGEGFAINRISANDQGLSHNSKFNGTTKRIGIDVSSHNGNINWAEVKASGVEFVFIRMSYRAYASGTLATDTKAYANIQGALAAGLKVGVYIFSQAITQQEAKEEANYICNQLSAYNVTLPVVMDYEYVSSSDGLTGRLYNANLSSAQATSNVMSFCSTVASRGYSAMLYANKSFLENNVDAATIASAYKIWLANYTNSTSYAGDYSFWQYSSKGSISGISGNVDCDIWYDGSVASTGNASISYSAHVSDIGWQNMVSDGELAGTTGLGKKLESIKISETGNSNLGVTYRTHIQDVGWETSWKTDGQESGTTGKNRRLEAIQVKLTGSEADNYDIYYCAHVQNFGWLNWAKNGAYAGSSSYGYRIEAIKMVILPKGSAAPSRLGNRNESYVAPMVYYSTQIQNVGWQNTVADGGMSGTSGQSLRLEGIKICLGETGYSGSIQYRTHVQNIGWENAWTNDWRMSGTEGKSLRLEAIEIKLTGDIENYYDVYYRVHCENLGWLGWTCNGNPSGSEGFSYRLEAIQIKLVPKGSGAPGITTNAFVVR